jgi:hypothetical protein
MLVLTGLLRCGAPSLHGFEALPNAAEVTRRMVEHSQAVARADQGPHYAYLKHSSLERLDATGRRLSSEEKIYEVKLIAGLPFNRLVRIQGRESSPEELAREDAREEKFQRRFVSTDTKTLAARREGLVTPELLERYDFMVESRVVLSNRSTLVLAFKPKAGSLPCSKLVDRLLNRMAGRLWIDEAEADTARIEAYLMEPVHLGWFGWLGSLNQFELSLQRQRMPDGVWINTRQALLIQCRKMTTMMRFRTHEESSDFKKVTEQQPGGSRHATAGVLAVPGTNPRPAR